MSGYHIILITFEEVAANNFLACPKRLGDFSIHAESVEYCQLLKITPDAIGFIYMPVISVYVKSKKTTVLNLQEWYT